jgi:hypothetical protein
MPTRFLALYGIIFTCATMLFAAAQNSPTPSQKIPVMDGGAGPCSCELIILMPDGKPATAADIKVHLAYGFGGFRRLDLEAGANVDGKVDFTGLPEKIKHPPLEFQASKDQWEGVVRYDPAAECQAKHEITLGKAEAKAK